MDNAASLGRALQTLPHSAHLAPLLSLMPLALSNSGCFFFSLLRFKKKKNHLVCSNLALTLQFDISECTFVSCLLPCVLLRYPLCKAGHLHIDHTLVPTIQGCVLAAGGCSDGSHPAFQYLSSCLSFISYLLLLHMFSGRGSWHAKTGVWKENRPTPVQSLTVAEDVA